MTSPPLRWSTIAESLTRPYRVTLPMVVLVSLIPGYLFIASSVAGRTLHAPALPLDGMIPLRPTWALLYGPLYLFLIILPVFVVRQESHLRRTVWAYLLVWLVSFAVFLAYPTVAPRPAAVAGEGFAASGLRFLYGADPPYNCFPSIHVAHSFVSALTCLRAHRGVGAVAVVSASLVALSTLFAKQHYVLDVVAGAGLALGAYAFLLRSVKRGSIAELDRRLVPAFALLTGGLVGVALLGFWVAYRLS